MNLPDSTVMRLAYGATFVCALGSLKQQSQRLTIALSASKSAFILRLMVVLKLEWSV